ncbi:hypothetical protein ACFQJD_17100 [Haloplanus sp. GCM10025708]|uniref:hypothetical protein n=1 Tax=Haloferacaceae TaxID=1644056 RepID=UPI00361DA677
MYGLLALGMSAVSVAVLPSADIFRHVTVVDVVTGELAYDRTAIVVAGGCLLVGVAAVLLGSLLAVVAHRQ